ncbi:MAG: cytochrome c family protein [Proteobacteria bacterium]|nr:cytochrome c family protein [Pseudomonadota bacterium]
MKRSVTYILIICACILGQGVVYAEDLSDAFPSMSMFEKITRPPVRFDHDGHNETNALEDCSICHHRYDGKHLLEGESSEDQTCADCHSLRKTKENSMPLMKAFHLQCKGCHEENGKGPKLCGECHVKSIK